METAGQLAQLPVHLFRAGVWKPRTRPGSFEGNGAPALEWLQEMKQQYGLPYTIEVAEPEHVDLALKYGADVLWIGARSTVNPFHVQRLADALKGVSIPVMVKNPVNPDINLWIGAIERFEKSGIQDVAAIHRGFSGYSPAGGYRNQPNWPIPIELKRRRSDIPVICDPSHITGRRDKIAEVAQRAMDMRFDGLMIETHPRPDEAWSDADQQITVPQLAEILSTLIVREEFTADMDGLVRLEYLRQLMDTLDAEIIDLIGRRMELSQQIGEVKRSCNLTAYQPARWREIMEVTASRAASRGLSEELITSIYQRIHDESIRLQLQLLEQTGKEANK